MLYNIYGQKVKSMTGINGNKVILSRDALTDGIYILK